MIFEWHYIVPVTLCFLFLPFFFIQYKIGICLLIPLITVLWNFTGVYLNIADFPSHINAFRYVIPLYLPLYFFMVATFIVRKSTGLEPKLETKNPLAIPMVLLFIYITLNIIISPTVYHFLNWSFLCLNISIYYFIINIVNNEAFHRRLMWFWVLSGFIVTVLVFGKVIINPDPSLEFRYQYPLTDNIYLFLVFVNWYERGHGIGSPAYTSVLLNLTTSIVFGLFIYEKKKICKDITTNIIRLLYDGKCSYHGKSRNCFHVGYDAFFHSM